MFKLFNSLGKQVSNKFLGQKVPQFPKLFWTLKIASIATILYFVETLNISYLFLYITHIKKFKVLTLRVLNFLRILLKNFCTNLKIQFKHGSFG